MSARSRLVIADSDVHPSGRSYQMISLSGGPIRRAADRPSGSSTLTSRRVAVADEGQEGRSGCPVGHELSELTGTPARRYRLGGTPSCRWFAGQRTAQRLDAETQRRWRPLVVQRNGQPQLPVGGLRGRG